MKSKKIKSLLPAAVFITCIILVLYYFVNSVLDYIYLKTDFSYTISASISVGASGKTGTDSKYTFYLNGKWYAGHTKLPLRKNGTKYFIKFYPKNPNRNKATKIIANSEDVKHIPPDGYKNLPHQ
jgi:hypothetical protein